MCGFFYENMNTRYYVEGVHTYGVSIYIPTTVLMFNMNKSNILYLCKLSSRSMMCYNQIVMYVTWYLKLCADLPLY